MGRKPAEINFLTPEYQERWRTVQDSFARITGLSIWTIDCSGKVIGKPSSPSSLCLLLRKNTAAREICNNDCIQHCQRSLRNNSTVLFRCHADLQCFATPVRSCGHPIGVILGGQVLTGSPPLEKYRNLARKCTLSEENVLKAVTGLSMATEKMLGQASEFITEMAQIAFSGWDSRDRISRQLTLLGNLFTLGSEFSPDMDIHEVYALTLNSLSILFNLENAALIIDGPRERDLVVRYALGPQREKLMRLHLKHEDFFMERFYGEGGPFLSDDYYLLLRSGFPEEIKQVSLFPLFSGEQLQGILAVFNHSLDDESVKMISYFASQVSMTIQNASLRADLGKNMAALRALDHFNEKVCGTLEMDELLGVIFEEMARLAKAEKASLMVLNSKTRELIIKLVKGSKGDILKNYAIPFGDGPAGQVARDGRPLLVKNLEQDKRFLRSNRPDYRTPSFVILPLKVAGRTIGVLNITDKIDGQIYNEDDLDMLRTLATQATVALQRAELFELSRELKKISITDSMTGLLNRRYFQERATEEIERSRRYGQPLSLIMIDVDDYKFYNDRHGHLAGDQILKNIGTILKAKVRNIDVVSRYGGEEFAILSPNSNKDKALQIAERIRTGMQEHIFPLEKEQPGGSLTISAGVATFPSDASSLEELINNADKALYLSKKSGKNRATPFRVSA